MQLQRWKRERWWSLPIVDKQEGTKVEPLITLFKELNYLKQEDQNDK